jgi:hypothetical protein
MESIKFPMRKLTIFNKDLELFAEYKGRMSFLGPRNLIDDGILRLNRKKPFFGYIEEEFMTLHLSMFLKKHSPMNRVFNKKIDQLIEAGIVNHLLAAQFAISTDVKNEEKEREKQDDAAEQLTMEHLDLCFIAVLIGLALSCIAFLFEVLMGYFSYCCNHYRALSYLL